MNNTSTPNDNPFEKPDVAAAWVSSLKGGDPFREANIYPGIKAWGAALPPDTILADIGAGDGECDFLFDDKITEILMIEPAKPLLEIAQSRKYPSVRMRQYMQLSADDLVTIADRSVDAALSVNVVFHLNPVSLRLAIKEMARILKPQGQAYVVTANAGAYDMWQSMYEIFESGENWWRGRLRYKGNTGIVTVPESLFYAHPREILDQHFADEGLVIRSETVKPEGRNTSLAIVLQKV